MEDKNEYKNITCISFSKRGSRIVFRIHEYVNRRRCVFQKIFGDSKPFGRLYIAYCDDQLAGCIGLRKIDDENCEMKRLYVRPEFRGKQIGNQLVKKIIDDAKEIGYAHMLLDTLPFLQSAIHMYKQHGFYEIPSYNDSPMTTSIYMRLDL